MGEYCSVGVSTSFLDGVPAKHVFGEDECGVYGV